MKLRMGTHIGVSWTMDGVILMLSWYLFGWMFLPGASTHALFPVWVLMTSAFSLTILGAIGYFDHYIPQPEMSGMVSLLFALPLSAFIAKWMLLLSSQIPPIRYTEALKASIMVAIVFEVAQFLIFRFHRALGRKWNLVTQVSPDELQTLKDQIHVSGAEWWIHVIPITGAMAKEGLRGDETVVISRKAVRHVKDHPELVTAHLNGQEIVDLRQLLKEFRGRISLDNVDAWTFILGSTYQSFPIRMYFYIKEFVEVLLAIVLLAAISPLLIGIAIAILVKMGQPILYSQKRQGYRGKTFSLYKFRSMANAAEKDGPQWAQKDDDRLKPFGKWLRKTRIDELPQLLNVIFGDLSFVGPRPERPEFYVMLSEKVPLFSTRLLVRPGITGWAQVRQGYAASIEESKTKLEYDLYYVQKMSPQLDIRIMLNTAAMMIRGNSGR